MANQGEGPVKTAIEQKLRAALAPIRLTIIDESHRHAGHGGHHPEGESHFRVELVSAAFAGKSRVERHRLVHGVLAEELATRVHALALTAQAPGEAG